jgi:adenylate cyclase
VGREDLANSEEFQKLRNLTIEMLAHYRNKDWENALNAIVKAKAANRVLDLQSVFDLYAERIASFKVNPPPPEWDGVFALTTK